MRIRNKDVKYLCVVAGGSGGHILPAFVLAKRWQNENPGGKIIYLGTSKSLDKKITNLLGIKFKKHNINLCSFPGKKLWLYPKFCTQLLITFLKSFFNLRRHRPKHVLSTGGYIAIPVCMAASLLKIPVELHELNVVPGRATRFLLPYSQKIFVTFNKCKEKYLPKEHSVQEKTFFSEYPVRYEEKDKNFSKEEGISFINQLLRSNEKTFRTKESGKLGCESLNDESFIPFDLDRKTIFIMGGSQGSFFINSLFKDWLEKEENRHSKIQVIHQTGNRDDRNWHSFYREMGIPSFIFSFYDNLKIFYSVADLVICRAGAGTLFELEFFKKLSLVLPLKTKQTSHQIFNAQEMAAKNPDLFVVQNQSLKQEDLAVFSKNIENML